MRIKHIMELLRHSLERCGYKKIRETEERPLLESNRIRGKGRRLQENISGDGGGDVGQWARGDGLHLNSIAQSLKLLFVENVLVVLGKKLVDPQEKGSFLDVH